MKRTIITLLLLINVLINTLAQSPWERIAQRPPTLFMDSGESQYTTQSLRLTLVDAAQVVKHLSPLSDTSFDFTPGDRIDKRDRDGLYHLGDINLMLRQVGDDNWQRFSTAAKRHPVKKIPLSINEIAAADLSASLPSDIPVNIRRYWEVDNGDLILRFQLTNNSTESVEIGSLGIPMIFNNILEGKSLDEAHRENVFFDPYIGMDAGYLQINRLHGKGSSLLIIPHQNAPFEAYNPLNDDPTPRGVVFEGFHEWLIHSKANAELEWEGVEPCNIPTSTILSPGEKEFSLKFILSLQLEEIENTLVKEDRPVAVGIPGYVL